MGLLQNALSTELVVSSNSYIFDGAGGMRDELEQSILKELELKQYPLKTAVETVKSGGIFGTKEECVTIEVGQAHRVVISITTVGTYLYVGVYHLIRVLNTVNQMNLATTITDVFVYQHTQAAYASAIACCESAFEKFELKQIDNEYHPIVSGV